MKVFITGGTGFIGKYAVERFAQCGYAVRVLVRDSSLQKALNQKGIETACGDITAPETLREGMRGCDWVVHLAGQYAMWHPDPSSFDRINVEGTRNVMRAALEQGVSKVVHISTVAVYGKPADCPFTEKSAPGPVLYSQYARSKAEGEQVAWKYFYQQGLPLVVLYPGIVLGAGDERASGQYIQLILNRRTPSTIFHNSPATYVHVRDVADAVVRAAEKPDNLGEKYLLGKETLCGREYAQWIHEISGVPLPPLRLPDLLVRAASYLFTGLSTITHQPPLWTLSVDAERTLKNGFCFDGSKAERELGISYRPVRQALSEAIAGYRAKKEIASKKH